MNLPAPSVWLLQLSWSQRTEWEEHPNTGDGMQMIAHSHQKTRTSVTTLSTERATELHYPLSCHHHRTTEGVHIPVGDILKVEC